MGRGANPHGHLQTCDKPNPPPQEFQCAFFHESRLSGDLSLRLLEHPLDEWAVASCYARLARPSADMTLDEVYVAKIVKMWRWV